jgi:hypothetical protein
MSRWGTGSDSALSVDDISSIIEVTAPGTLRNLRVGINIAFVASSVSYTVRVNGVDTAITVTIAAATSGQDTTHTVAVTTGDKVSIHVAVVSGAPLNTGSRADLQLDWT